MSKKILRPLILVGAIVATAVTGGALIPLLGAGGLGLGAAAAAGLSTALMTAGIGVAAGLLTKVLGLTPKAPAVSGATRDRLFASLVADTPRAFVFGRTAMATDVRYQTFTDNQQYYHQIMCVAAHEVEAIEEIWFDTEKAWSASGGVTSKYAGYLTVTPRLVGSAGNTIAIDSKWGANQRLTGCAYIHLRYKLLGNDRSAEGPFSQQIPTRVTVRGKGAKTYDPRFDSTAGGSGAQRADNQATWAYAPSGVDSGRNPALQLLWYLLGWRIQNPATGEWKLSVGRGWPADRIDMESFITAANMCDEPVTKAAGGTEPRYRADGPFTEGDDPGLVTGNLCAAMNAVLRDAGGKIALTVLHNDLASPVAHFTEADILGNESWKQTAPVDQTFNLVRGRFTDPSDSALYQLVDYPEVEIASFDGLERVDTFDLAVVESPSQSQRLAKQRLQRNQYQGMYQADFNARAWQVSLGKLITLSHSRMGWVSKKFRVIAHTIRVDGVVPMLLQEEHEDIYQWDADERPAVEVAEPTHYDPALSALALGIAEAGGTAEWPNVLDPDGTRPTDNADITGENTAAGIVGQGTGATANDLAGLNGTEADRFYNIEDGATLNRPERSINRNSAFDEWTSGAQPIGWTVTRGSVSRRPGSGSSSRGPDAITMAPDSALTSEKIPANAGDVFWLDQRFHTVLDRTGGGAPTWYVGIDILDANGTYLGAYYPVYSNTPVSVAAGMIARIDKLTVPTIAGQRYIVVSIYFDNANPGTGSNGVVDYLSLTRHQPAADITNVNIAAGVTGQGPWATNVTPISSIERPPPNLVFDGALRLRAARWDRGTWAWYSDTWNYLYNSGEAQVAHSDFFPAYAGLPYSIQAEATVHLGTHGYIQILWFDGSDAYLGASAAKYLNEASGAVRLYPKLENQVAPAGTAQAKVRLVSSQNNPAGGYTAVGKFKVESNIVCSLFSDEATTSALYETGVNIDLLRPGEFGSNVTETRIASGFTGQGGLATRNFISWSNTDLEGLPYWASDGLVIDGGVDPRNTRLRAGYMRSVLYPARDLETYFPEDIGSNRTEARIASGFTGQATIATQADAHERITRLGTDGRVSDPRLYNTALLVGPSNTTNIAPSYGTQVGSTFPISIPAHERRIAGPSGPITLSYGSGSAFFAANSTWHCYVDDPDLTGIASPTYSFTNTATNLLYPGRYHVASGRTPVSGGTGGSTGGGGGGGGGGWEPGQEIP